ncbi:phage head-tail adaptor, putative, SPP1 family [Hoeflea sp. IMCC20628]|uniref:phage head closure protein n=1 Tax=Hoeflea sp. IMCC20628 TaxID=1620421 RepID=UPI00063A9AAF|nr:phage head closure protein [Hoeflea sp. IMCC20628]AKI01217.1 phage head-tail adaptor, putative, SPP1 family [Hoeflea sp. IMCC20628]
MASLFVDPGRLSARLALEAPTDLPDGQGGVAEGWTLLAELWGRIEPLRAKAEEQAGAATAPITHRVTIRYRGDVRHAMRFAYRDRTLFIRSLRDPEESRRYLVCDCEEARP